MSRVARLLAATTLAFGSLFFASPAFASDWQTTNGNLANGSVQFSYYQGTATQTLEAPEGSTLTLTVNNTIANRIGAGDPLPDSWSVTINGQVFSGNTAEVATISVPVSGPVEVVVSGIDRGFWAGWYGPIFSAPVISSAEPTPSPTPTVEPSPTPEPTPSLTPSPTPSPEPEPSPIPTPTPSPEPSPVPVEPAPDWWTGEVWEGGEQTFTAPEGFVISAVTAWYGAPTDSNCGADVSNTLTELVTGQASATVSLSNGTFGDPCGGVVKVTRYSVTYVAAVAEPAPTPEPTPTPQPEPQPQPEPAPPVVEPEPIVIPQPEPVYAPPAENPPPQPPVEPTPEPVPTETPEPAPLPPTPPVEPEKAPEPVPSPAPAPIPTPEPVLPTPGPILPTPEPVLPVVEETPQQLMAEAQADDPIVPEELASIPLIGNAAVAVLEAFNALGNVGADLTPEVREKAQEVVVSSVIVGQIATASMATSSAASYRRNK